MNAVVDQPPAIHDEDISAFMAEVMRWVMTIWVLP